MARCKVAHPELRDRQWLLFGQSLPTLQRVASQLEADPYTAITVCDSRDELVSLALTLSPGVITLTVLSKPEILETLAWLKTHVSRFRSLGVRVLIVTSITDERIHQSFLSFGAAEVLSTWVPEPTLLHKLRILTKTLGARRRAKLVALDVAESQVFKADPSSTPTAALDFRLKAEPPRSSLLEDATRVLADLKAARELRLKTRDQAREGLLYRREIQSEKISGLAMLIHMSDQLSRGEAMGSARQWLVDFMRKELNASAVEWVDFRMNTLNVSPKETRTGTSETLKFEIPDRQKHRMGLAYGWIRVWHPGADSLTNAQKRSIEQVVCEMATFGQFSA